MKKSVLLGTVALGLTAFATGASAQSSTPVMGAGTNANEAFIIQRQFGNKATVDQTGTNNKAGRLSTNVDLSAANLSSGNLDAVSNGAYSILQNGYFNELSVTQSGSNNTVLTVTGNRFGGPYGPNAYGGSFQQGDLNKMTSTQNGSNGQAQFQQIGNFDRGTIFAEQGSSKTYAGIFQFGGNENKATINQRYHATDAYAAIVQAGSKNEGTIDQNGYVNYAALLQVGKDNDASITQTGSYLGAFGYQNGYDNKGSISQSGNLANAAFVQVGAFNSVTIKQH